MNRYYFRVTLVLSVLFYNSSPAQQLSSCDNADFEFNNFNNWTGRTGACCPVGMSTTGIVAGRHTIVSGPGTDPQSGGLVPFVPPGGGQYAARLGNAQTGAQAEQLSYTFPVTTNTALFIYRYAVILQDPNHNPSAQPRFSIRVFDQNNNPVTCGTYDVVASANIPGFVSIGSIRVKPWTTVGIELSSYVGQNITIEFTTADCGHGAHFGFAYMDAYCSPFQIVNDFCPGTSITTLNAPPGFESYLWSTGDTTETIVINNPVIGTVYTVTMTSVTGCQVSLNTILTPTNINASFYTLSACSNRVQFIDSSYVITGSAVSNWQWDFGDGTTSTQQHPIHTYSAPGIYQVSLIVGNTGCHDTLVKTVQVLPVPASNFTYTPMCPGIPVDFVDQTTYSLSPIVSWTWDFGDGSAPVTLQNPSHTFASVGPYDVMLFTEAQNGCMDTVIKTVYPYVQPSPAISYVASCNSTTVEFINQSSYICGIVTGHQWDFGDGSPLSLQANPIHNYSSPGVYQVTYVVEGTGGSTASLTLPVIVPDLPDVDFTVPSACHNEPNIFNDVSSVFSGTIIDWSWDFGDGTFASGIPTVSHIYSSPGNYTARLVATSSFNCVDSASKVVDVWELPVAGILADTLEGCEPLTVNFQSMTTSAQGVVDGWSWYFGNGQSDSVPIPSVIFNAGTYDVSLIGITNYGCRDTLTLNNLITAWPLPKPDFTYTPERISIFLPVVKFTDRSWDAISWWWDFGDNTTSIFSDPEHRYKSSGIYLASLEVESNLGCRDMITKVIEVFDEPTIYFPNAFTPNADGTNDIFYGVGEGINEFRLYIFNRWGKLIHTSVNSESGWNGTYNNHPVPEGTYTYLANITDINNRTHQVKGIINLIK